MKFPASSRPAGVPVFPGNRETALLTTFSRQASLPAKRGRTTIVDNHPENGHAPIRRPWSWPLASGAAGESTGLFELSAPSKQRRGTAVRGTANWDVAMKKAKGQAERYARSLPPAEGSVA